MNTMLLAVSGMSPAIITETLYGMNKRGDAWPQSIKVITTSVGEEKVWNDLIKQGYLSRLCDELGKPMIKMEQSDILVVPNAAGEPVVDARSEEDNEALANFITSTVRDFAQDPNTAIHASLAGGRKTMTFYLGYAMTLFGRHFDKLSHVLVSDGFESHPEFYFPTRSDQWITDRSNNKLNMKDAIVTLADIPFIRQRQLVPEILTEFGEEVNFRQLVNLINLGEDQSQIRLTIHSSAQQLTLTSPFYHDIHIEIAFNNVWSWVLYLLIIEDSLLEVTDSRGEFTRPSNHDKDRALASLMASKLAEIKGIQITGTTLEEKIEQLLNQDQLIDQHPNLERTLKPIYEKGGISGTQFDTYLQNIQSQLQHALPKNLVHALTPMQIFDADGNRLENTGKIKHRGAGYGIALPNPSRQITID